MKANIERKDLEIVQWQKLQSLLKVLFKKNQFYKKKYTAVGIKDYQSIKDWKDFKKLPFTTKKELIKDQLDFPPFGRNITQKKEAYFFIMSTTGTTGKPFIIPCTKGDIDNSVNNEITCLEQIGALKGERALHIFPYAQYPTLVEGARRSGLVVIPGDARTPLELLKKIINFEVSIIFSSPSAMYELNQVAEEFKINIKKESKVRKILLSGESGVTNPKVRSTLEDIWGAKCYDMIGSAELRVIGLECPYQSGTHLLEDSLIAEVIDPTTGKESLKGELVVTLLWRYDYPLIRYRTGDFVELKTKLCQCGSPFHRLEKGIIGKIDGTLRIRGFSYFPSQLESIIKEFDSIKEYRLEVDKKNGIDIINIFIELPIRTKINVPSLLKRRFEEYLDFTPSIIVMPPSSLKIESWKGKRVIDLRVLGNVSIFGNKRPLYHRFYQQLAKINSFRLWLKYMLTANSI